MEGCAPFTEKTVRDAITIKLDFKMARRGGFEPPTPRFVVWCSIQLSYRRLDDQAVFYGVAQISDAPYLVQFRRLGKRLFCL